MTPPTSLDHFLNNYQYQILGTAFATQIFHYQFIKRTESALASGSTSATQALSFGSFFRPSSVPRPLRAGLAWAAVFAALMTKTTLAQKAIRDFKDPVVANLRLRREALRGGL